MLWLIGAVRKIRDRKLAKRRFEALSLAKNLGPLLPNHVKCGCCVIASSTGNRNAIVMNKVISMLKIER